MLLEISSAPQQYLKVPQSPFSLSFLPGWQNFSAAVNEMCRNLRNDSSHYCVIRIHLRAAVHDLGCSCHLCGIPAPESHTNEALFTSAPPPGNVSLLPSNSSRSILDFIYGFWGKSFIFIGAENFLFFLLCYIWSHLNSRKRKKKHASDLHPAPC